METLFDKFGGIRPMAEHLGEAPSTIQGWKSAGRIPATKQPFVLKRARDLGIAVSHEEIIFPLGKTSDEVHADPDTIAAAQQTPGKSPDITGAAA